MVELITRSPDETRAFGERLSQKLQPGDVLLLHGDLGAGKTTLTQGIARGLGITEDVQSPTFTLVNEHVGRLAGGQRVMLYHVDLYRLREEAEVDSFGYDDYLAPTGAITIVEWPERAPARLPEAYLLVRLGFAADDARTIALEARPPAGPLARRLGHLLPPAVAAVNVATGRRHAGR